MTNWRFLSAADLGRRIGAGEIDPVELTEAFLEATAAHEAGPRIYARMTETRARAEAEAARAFVAYAAARAEGSRLDAPS